MRTPFQCHGCHTVSHSFVTPEMKRRNIIKTNYYNINTRYFNPRCHGVTGGVQTPLGRDLF